MPVIGRWRGGGYTPVPHAGRTRFWGVKKSTRRTKVDTMVDLRFVCVDCNGDAVKQARSWEKSRRWGGAFGRCCSDPRWHCQIRDVLQFPKGTGTAVILLFSRSTH
jgi:hypothetical protein